MHEQNDGRPGGGTAVMQVRPSWHRPADPAGWTDAELLAWIVAVRHLAAVLGRDVRWALPDDVRAEIAA